MLVLINVEQPLLQVDIVFILTVLCSSLRDLFLPLVERLRLLHLLKHSGNLFLHLSHILAVGSHDRFLLELQMVLPHDRVVLVDHLLHSFQPEGGHRAPNLDGSKLSWADL